ncbi:MAG TPA: rhodanese-like domain-containing protein [Anaerolineaceae bacterium]|nr:rhodanese-like domain-containing protein [Anaerolineaceae bacterium]HQK05800.1 rhodanese-like domain-containing protein [Anaerolineaceae bacterium]HRS74197.1 rhodanese-like domain-containing protein [Anaerolineaceae bacterium]HRT91536.1 rhodanese-like domain-containing protein [Anaerolineaceae bacterium]HUM62448.1 rhodanese-like domain-containing protein [Anaerolineaceae bacterium]
MATKTSKKKQQKQTKWLLPLILVSVAVIIGVVLSIAKEGHAAKGLPSTVSVTEAAQRINEGAFLLDVRTAEEWNQAHVAGAVRIPLDELKSRLAEVPVDQDVLIICRSGNRSGQARDLLRAAGLKRTTSISGGINAWMAKGLPVVSGP